MIKNNSIRTLFLTTQVPYPAVGGAALRNWQNINIMMEFGPVAIFSVTNSSEYLNTNELPPGVDIWSNHQKRYITKKRSFWQNIVWWMQPNTHPLMDLAYQESFGQELDKLINKFQPDIVIVEELWLYRYLSIIQKNKRYHIILDEHNVEASLYQQNQISKQNLKSKIRFAIQYNKLKFIERDFVRQVQQVWICSNSDADLLSTIYGKFSHIRVIPNSINTAYFDDVRLGNYVHSDNLEKNPHTLLFAGTYSYPPNTVAAQLLIDKIFPYLQQRYPECRLILLGKSPTLLMLKAAEQNPGIIVTGMVEDVRPYLAISNVVIVPLLQGGGTRLKILEAFASFRAVVSTTKGVEGIAIEDGKHLLVRDNIDELAEGVCELWENKVLADKLAENAYQLVKDRYSWEAISKNIKMGIKELIS